MTAIHIPVATLKAITFSVPSSDPRKPAYTVTCDPSDLRVLDCNCPHRDPRRGNRSTFCRHMKLVATPDHGGIKPRIRVGPAAQPARRDTSIIDSLYS